MAEPWEHYAKSQKSDTGGHILYNSFHILYNSIYTVSRIDKSAQTESRQGADRDWGEEIEWPLMLSFFLG